MRNKIVAPKRLVAKIAEAMDAIGGVEKKGRNERQNYPYLRAADVAKAFRHELFKRGVILIANEKNLQHEMVETNSGGKMRFVTLTIEYTLQDELEKSEPVQAFGQAMDAGDKALWKAKTGALKYYLRGLGILPDEKDDPEADEEVDKSVGPPQVRPDLEAKMEGQQRIKQHQVKGIQEACKRTGKSLDQQAEYLDSYHLVQWEELTKERFNDAIRWANVPSQVPADLAESLTKSIAIRKKRTTSVISMPPQPAVTLAEQKREDEFDAGD